MLKLTAMKVLGIQNTEECESIRTRIPQREIWQ